MAIKFKIGDRVRLAYTHEHGRVSCVDEERVWVLTDDVNSLRNWSIKDANRCLELILPQTLSEACAAYTRACEAFEAAQEAVERAKLAVVDARIDVERALESNP